jgi:hypothetical protein
MVGLLTSGGPDQIPAGVRAGVAREELGKLPSAEVELLWGLAGGGGGGATGPRRGRELGAAERAMVVLGFGWRP